MSQETFKCVVTEVGALTGHVTFVELRRSDGEPVEFVPGQHVVFHFPGTPSPMRYYSIATPPGDGAVGFCVKHAGLAEDRPTHLLQEGDEVELSGPIGSLVLREPAAPFSLFFAQGTGVTPFLAMRDQMAGLLESGKRVRVVLGFRTMADCWCLDDFDDLMMRYHGFDVELVLTQPDPRDPGNRGHRMGALLDEFVWDVDPSAAHAYVAGSPEMVVLIRDQLVELGFARDDVITEGYFS